MSAVTTEGAVVDGVNKQLFIGGEWRDASGGGTMAVEDPSTAEALCEVADATPEDALAALEAARDTARLSPVRRQSLGRLEYYELATDHLDLIVPSSRVLARASLHLLRGGEPAPKAHSGAVADLSWAVGALAEYLEEPGRSPETTRQLALAAARDANAVLQERNDLAIAALVAQIRSTTVDIFRGDWHGLPRGARRARAGGRQLAPRAHRRPEEPRSFAGAAIVERRGRAVRHQQTHQPVLDLREAWRGRHPTREEQDKDRWPKKGPPA